MKVLLLVCFLAFAAAVSLPEPEMQAHFSHFVQNFNKVYLPEEMEIRYQNFMATTKRIQLLNEKSRKLGPDSAFYVINEFSDMSPEEFKSKMLSKVPKFDMNEFASWVSNNTGTPRAPPSLDWRNSGVVTAVYNQGNCGSCWAFSATETIESSCALATRQLRNLAMQQILDCDHGDGGCGGGLPMRAYQYVQQQGGIDSYNSYPYMGYQGGCRYNPGAAVCRVTGYTWASSGNEPGMVEFTATHGPISVCVDAEQWMSYGGGIVYASMCGRNIDHAVVAVGYNIPGGYWIVRNSWGTGWGIGGYIMLQYNANTCGVAQYPSWASAN